MPKRTSGEGIIYQLPDGLWRVEITLGYDGGGKRKKKAFGSRDFETVQKKVNDFKYKLGRNVAVQKSDYAAYEWAFFGLTIIDFVFILVYAVMVCGRQLPRHAFR